MRAERVLLNRAEFDVEMREIHESPRYGGCSQRGVRLRQPSAGLVGREGVLQQAFGRHRPASAAEHVDKGA